MARAPPWIRWVSFSYPPRSGFATRKDMIAALGQPRSQ